MDVDNEDEDDDGRDEDDHDDDQDEEGVMRIGDVRRALMYVYHSLFNILSISTNTNKLKIRSKERLTSLPPRPLNSARSSAPSTPKMKDTPTTNPSLGSAR